MNIKKPTWQHLLYINMILILFIGIISLLLPAKKGSDTKPEQQVSETHQAPAITEEENINASNSKNKGTSLSQAMIQNDDLEILYSPFHYISTLAPDEKDLVQQYSNKFGEQNRYQPGVYLVKFNDSETIQYLDEFFIDQISSSEYFKVMDGKTKKMKGVAQKAMEHNLKILQDLDKKYGLIAITRPKMRFHRPQETSVYRNNFYHISFNKRYTDNNRETDEILPLMQNLSQSKYVAQRTIARPMASYPDDPLKSHMRYFDEIEVPEAWEAIENYNQGHVVVGLIEGVNSHPDLPGGFAGSSDHGTHTAGSIAAITNNGIGVPAISNNNATLLVSPGGGADCPACRDSALDSVSSASIVSVSQLAGFWLKNSSNAKYLEDIIRGHNNTLFLMAAGNENLNPDTDYGRGGGQYCCRPSDGAFNAFPGTRGIYPGELGRNSYGLNNFITVAASTTNASKASFSCYGDRISLASPGTSILSTVPGGGYQARGGTSMATPVAASFATLLKALDSSLSASALKGIMQDTADPISRAGGAGRINVCQGVAALNYPCGLAQENCSGTSDTNGDGEIGCEDPTCAVRKDVTDKKVCEGGSVQIDATTPRATTYLREHGPTTPIIKVTPTQTTIYKVKITNVHSCSKTISIKVETKASSPEICNDGYDNDCNEKTDCADPTCSNNSSCQSPSPTPPNPGMFRPKAEKCDGDRDTCKRNEGGEKFCTDGIDNDDNGEIDCADSNCRCMSICGTKECNCCDEIDNDGNGKIDCKSGKEDSECDCDKTSFSTQQETIPIQKSGLRPNFENTNLTQFDL